MSATIVPRSNCDPCQIWPGHAGVSRAGVELAVNLMGELENRETTDDSSRVAADFSNIEDWPRQGAPFRNIVAEYLLRARSAGPEVEAGFCAVLSDLVSLACGGECTGGDRYAEMFGID